MPGATRCSGARAGVGGEDEGEPRRIARNATRPGDDDAARLERLAERLEHTGRKLGGLVQKKHTAVGQARRTWAGEPGSATDQRGNGGGVVHVAKRCAGHQWTAGVEHPRDGVDGRHLEGCSAVERRQQPRQAFGEHRLAAAGRPGQKEVVPPCGSHLDGATPPGLAEHISEVRRVTVTLGRHRTGPCGSGGIGVGRARRRAARRAPAPRAAGRRAHATNSRRGPWRRAPGPPQPRWLAARRSVRCPLGWRPVRLGARRAPPALARRDQARPTRRCRQASRAPGRRPRRARRRPAPGRTRCPVFGSAAGDKLTVIFVLGHSPPLLSTAALTRSRACCTAVSGRPTIVVPGNPLPMSASTSINRPSIPTRATERVRATVTAPPPAHDRSTVARFGAGVRRPRQCAPRGSRAVAVRRATVAPTAGAVPASPA